MKSSNAPLVIYSALFGNYDAIPNWRLPPGWRADISNRRVEFVLFTDQPVNESCSPYEKIVIVEPGAATNTKKARFVKIMAHKFLYMYEFSVWIDAHVHITSPNLDSFLRSFGAMANSPYLPNDAVLAYKRHFARQNPEDEGDVLISIQKDTADSVNATLDFVKQAGFSMIPEQPFAETDILLRKHNCVDVCSFMVIWNDCVQQFSKRDQLSFNYAMWKSGEIMQKSIKCVVIPFESVFQKSYYKDKTQHGKNAVVETLCVQSDFTFKTDRHEWNIRDAIESLRKQSNSHVLYLPEKTNLFTHFGISEKEQCSAVSIEYRENFRKHVANLPSVLDVPTQLLSGSKWNATPKTAIVLTTHGRTIGGRVDETAKYHFEKCFKAVLAVKEQLNIFLIVFDNESVDQFTQTLPQRYADIVYSRSENQTLSGGLTGTWNSGARIALKNACDVVVFLNNDTVVDMSLHNLIQACSETAHEPNIYGPVSDRPGQQKMHIAQTISPTAVDVRWQGKQSRPQVKETDENINGFCFALHRRTLQSVRYDEEHVFDPHLPFGGNEVEYGRRLLSAGGKYLVVQNCYVQHSKVRSWI